MHGGLGADAHHLSLEFPGRIGVGLQPGGLARADQPDVVFRHRHLDHGGVKDRGLAEHLALLQAAAAPGFELWGHDDAGNGRAQAGAVHVGLEELDFPARLFEVDAFHAGAGHVPGGLGALQLALHDPVVGAGFTQLQQVLGGVEGGHHGAGRDAVALADQHLLHDAPHFCAHLRRARRQNIGVAFHPQTPGNQSERHNHRRCRPGGAKPLRFRQRQERPLPGRQRLQQPDQGHFPVKLRVAQRHRRLGGEDAQQIHVGLSEEPRRGALDRHHPHRPHLVFERQRAKAPHAGFLEVGGELFAGLRPGGVELPVPFRNVEQRPGLAGPLDQLVPPHHAFIPPVYRRFTRDRADAVTPLSLQSQGAAVRREQQRRLVDDRVQDAIQVERGGDLAAGAQQRLQLLDLLLRLVALGVADGTGGLPGDFLQQIGVGAGERATVLLAGDLEHPGRLFFGAQRHIQPFLVQGADPASEDLGDSRRRLRGWGLPEHRPADQAAPLPEPKAAGFDAHDVGRTVGQDRHQLLDLDGRAKRLAHVEQVGQAGDGAQ